MIKKRLWPVTFFIISVISIQVFADEIKIAAATSLVHVLEEISSEFKQQSRHDLKISYASSGVLTQQILQGAPYEIFLSANHDYISLLNKKGFTVDSAHTYGIGRLVLYIPHTSSIRSVQDLTAFIQEINKKEFKRLAIANPDYAPYGRLAKQVLDNLNVWNQILDKLIIANSASHAAQFGVAGAVDAALIPYSIVLIPEVQKKGKYLKINESLYDPLQQQMILLSNAGDAAWEFSEFLKSERIRALFDRYGFGKSELQTVNSGKDN